MCALVSDILAVLINVDIGVSALTELEITVGHQTLSDQFDKMTEISFCLDMRPIGFGTKCPTKSLNPYLWGTLHVFIAVQTSLISQALTERSSGSTN